ncbi:MAG TPA: hypothetical protein VLX92_03780 [Kofleriaceae bacterium]|nr:hypothetical protein [Kofleriaceae bacterium]
MVGARPLLVALAFAGCGRIGFDPTGGTSDASAGGDAGRDVPSLVGVATTTTNGDTLAVPLAGGGGELLVAAVAIYDPIGSVVGVSDDLGANTFVSAGAREVVPGTSSTEIWYAADSQPGATTVTVQLSAAVGGGLWLSQYTGVAPTAPRDQVAIATGVEAPTVAAPPVVTTSANELVVSVVVIASGAADDIAAGNPFIAMPAVNGDDAAYGVEPVPGSYGAVWDADGSGATCASTASFTAAPR